MKQPRETVERLTRVVEEWQPTWYPMSIYSEPGKAASAFYQDVLDEPDDPSGIYFFRAPNKAAFQELTGIPLEKRMFYVGRAGQIARRLSRHLKSVDHNSASLVYKITAQSTVREAKRADNMANEAFVR